jgi:hypothetical protein
MDHNEERQCMWATSAVKDHNEQWQCMCATSAIMGHNEERQCMWATSAVMDHNEERQCMCATAAVINHNEERQCILRQSQIYITTDSLSASPSWYQAPIWEPRLIFPILSFIIFGHFRVCWCRARSRVCSILFCRASPAQPFWDLSPTGLKSIAYCLFFETTPTRRARFLYLLSSGTG